METENNNLGAESPGKLQFCSFNVFRKPTMSETYQNLNILLKDEEVQKSKDLKKLILSDSPLPLFEECLKLAAIDYLQLESEVVRILLSQNDRQIKRILCCNWFFKSLSSEFCTSELFPYISASLRCKIITRVSKYLQSESEAEKYFEFIKRNYDNQRADYLLPRCSSEFILCHFEKHQPLFKYPAGVRVILNICKRHPEVGVRLLSHFFDSKDDYILRRIRNILLYLAGNHCDLFVPFLIKYHGLIEEETFGKKLTRKLGKKLKENLFSSFTKISFFKLRDLFLILGFKDRVKLLTGVANVKQEEALSFRSWTNLFRQLRSFLILLKPSDRLKMIEESFNQLYSLNFTDYPKCWSCGLLELLPTETRQPFVRKLESNFTAEEAVFEQNMSCTFSIEFPENFIHLYEFSTGFVKFKELLRCAPEPRRRRTILQQMVKNCSINYDLRGLEEVINFVALRHRHDDPAVIYNFIEAVCNEFPWSALSSSAFERLDELVHFCALKGNKNYYVSKQLNEKHIYFLVESGCIADAFAKAEDLFDNIIADNCCTVNFVQDLRCQHSRALLLALCDAAVRWINKNSSENLCENVFSCIIESCAQYNKVHPGSQILWEVTGLKEILNKRVKDKFADIGGEKWPLEIWGRYYHDVMVAPHVPNCLLYVFKQRPKLIETHFEGFLNCLIDNYSRAFKNLLFYFLRAASFLGKTEKIKEILLKEFKSGDSIRRREMALTLYSLVSTIEEFTRVVEDFIPKHEKVESGSDPAFGKIQLLIPRLIKNVKPRSKNFDLILKFFIGDFLKLVIPSLQACCHHTRVDVVIPFLKERLKILPSRVSYLKDIVRLIAELSTRTERRAFCMQTWREHEHYSIRAILLHFVSTLFVEQPSRESFEALEECILQSDPIIVKKKPELQDVPNDFLQDYTSALFQFSEQQTPAFRNSFQQSLLLYFERERINWLSPEFCERIIETNLFRPHSSLDVGTFTCAYLIADAIAVGARVRFVLGLVEGEWKLFSDFLRILIRRCWTDRSHRVAFANAFESILDNWPKCSSGILLEDRVLVTYHHLYRRALRTAADAELVAVEFAKELKTFYSGVDNLRDLIVIYAEALLGVFIHFESSAAILAVKELVTGPKDRSRAIIGILALPEEALSFLGGDKLALNDAIAKSKAAISDLVKIFESYDDEVVEIYMRRKFFF